MKILMGVSGGIAAYKSCEVIRRLREQDHEVQVVMSEAATHFVTPMTFQVLSGRPVATNLFDVNEEIEHLRLARWPDCIALVPATANLLGKIAHGMADDLLTTVVLASLPEVPVVVAPAMNVAMWENPLVRANIATLEEVGGGKRFRVVDPVEKTLACGETGQGALAEEGAILSAIVESGRAEEG